MVQDYALKRYSAAIILSLAPSHPSKKVVYTPVIATFVIRTDTCKVMGLYGVHL